MIVNHLSSNKRLHDPMYSVLALVFFLSVSLQPIIVKAELNSVEACQNQYLNQSECEEVGNGLCCQWDDSAGQCIFNIGYDICSKTTIMSPPPSKPNLAYYPLKEMSLTAESHPRTLSEMEAESVPSTSPTKYYDWSCNDRKTQLDLSLCMGFSMTQITALIITPKISSVLSISGSSYIIRDILKDPKKLKESTFHRIMFGLSFFDIFLSFAYFLGTWVMPKGENLFAVGSEVTCSITGFFMLFAAICAPLYNCSLATFYFLKLKFRWVNRKIKAVEKWLLFVPCAVGLIVSISASVAGNFGAWGYVCTSNSPIYGITYQSILLFSLGFVIITMFLVFRSVRSVEKGAIRYTFASYKSSGTNTMKMSRRVMLQGVLYSAALFTQNICFILSNANIPALNINFTFQILVAVLYPLQGCLNALIYMIPLFTQIMKKRQQSQQTVSRSSIQYQQKSITLRTWLTRCRSCWSVVLRGASAQKCDETINGGQIEMKGGCNKEEEEVLDGGGSNRGVGVLRLNPCSGDKIDINNKQEKQQMLRFHALSESKGEGYKSDEKENTKGDDESNGVATSSLMLLSYVEDGEEEVVKTSALKLSEISKLNKEEQLHLDYFSALEANDEICNNVDNETGNEESDRDESYIDDYLKMMED